MAPGTAQDDLRAIGESQESGAAGLWLTDGHRVLLLRRARWLDAPDTWTVPGGAIRADETLQEGATREFSEETGFLPSHEIVGHKDALGFRTYCAVTSEVGWVPLYNEESTGYVWADRDWLRENFADLHPGLQTILRSAKTAKRDTIDKSWINKVRKTWKTFAQKAKSVGYMEAEAYFQNGVDWLMALANDMAYSKGFFTFLREDKKEQTIAYKWKAKAMEELQNAWKYLNAGRDAVQFWDKTMTPGTREYEMGAGHRKSLESDPAGPEKALARTIRLNTVEAVTKADAHFSRKFLAHLTRLINQYDSPIEWGSYEREFSIGNVKVVMTDIPHPFVQKDKGGKHHPEQVRAYVQQLKKTEALLKQKGLGFLWYGTIFVSCKSCGGDNPLGKKWGVGAHYHPSKDTVTVFSDPSGGLYRLIAHELGHRYYFKFMSAADRARFDSYFGDVPAVSEYGGTVSEEDFAEVFSYYIDNRNLTRDQLERFKRFIKTKGRMAKEDLRLVRFARYTAPGEITELFIVQRAGQNYFIEVRKGSMLGYDIKATGNLGAVNRAFDQRAMVLESGAEGFSGESTLVTDKPDSQAHKALAMFEHPMFGLKWDKTVEVKSDAEDFHKLLIRQLKDWKGGSSGLAVTKHSYWPTFKRMVEDAVSRKFGTARLYRGIYGKIVRDVLAGEPLALRRYSSWTTDRGYAKDVAMHSTGGGKLKGDPWVVVAAKFPVKQVVFAPVKLPDFAPDPDVLLKHFVREDEFVIESRGAMRPGSFKVVNKTRMRLSVDDLVTLWSNRTGRAWQT